jgi:hypothetical protein
MGQNDTKHMDILMKFSNLDKRFCQNGLFHRKDLNLVQNFVLGPVFELKPDKQ